MRLDLFVLAALLITAPACDSSTKPNPGDQTPPLPDSLHYLGQQPPGETPQRFPPPELLANEDWFWHGSPAFSPDGREMYWCKYVKHPYQLDLQYMEIVDNNWTEPTSVSFKSEYGENNPLFSPDGEKVLFVSGRPGGFIYSTSRTDEGWTDPEPVSVPIPDDKGHGWQFTMAADGTLYFELWGAGGQGPDLYRSDLVDGEYTTPVALDALNTEYNEFAPYVHPDEEYLIFVSNRPGGIGGHDLYVSFRSQEDVWDAPINLGAAVNSESEDAAPLVSPDGKYLFFNSIREGDADFNPYWVDIQVIENQRKPRRLSPSGSFVKGSAMDIPPL
jgi:Tol biopolymer transport system component